MSAAPTPRIARIAAPRRQPDGLYYVEFRRQVGPPAGGTASGRTAAEATASAWATVREWMEGRDG